MKNNKLWQLEMSRRTVLQGAAIAAGTVPIVLATAEPALAAKMSQSSVGYQGSPKGSQSCGNCALFVAPSSCKNVEGPVSASGWCKIWVKKS
jgi:hypothetical protein